MNKKEKREELLKKLRDVSGGDQEADHGMADDALLEYIGDEEITKAFEDIPKWYA